MQPPILILWVSFVHGVFIFVFAVTAVIVIILFHCCCCFFYLLFGLWIRETQSHGRSHQLINFVLHVVKRQALWCVVECCGPPEVHNGKNVEDWIIHQ
jgi:hypothetical protein